MAGDGKRFKDAGYSTPKPLIKVDGKPMVIKALESLPKASKNILIVRKDQLNIVEFKSLLNNYFENVIIIEIDYLTGGQASTCLLSEKQIPKNSILNIGACDVGFKYDLNKYKETLNRIFGGDYDFTFNTNTKVLKILRKISVTEDIMIQVSNLVPEHNLLENEYSRPWMADWALAEAKMMLGEARSKYASGLPGPQGSVQLNGDALKQEAMTEKERLLLSIINMEEGNKNYGFVIG